MSVNQDIVKSLKIEEYADMVRFEYDGWLGFRMSVNPKNNKIVSSGIHDTNTQKSLDYEPSYAPIFHVAYKIAYDRLVKAKKEQSQLGLGLD